MWINGKDEIQQLTGHVLVAVDDAQFCDLLDRRAEKVGLSVQAVEDGNEAMEALEGEQFDLIVSDLYMPSHTGLEVIQQAQEKSPKIHAIILTASATVERGIGWPLI